MEKEKIVPIISMEGYNDNDEVFCVKVQTLSSYILDFTSKFEKSSSYIKEEMEQQVYQNYSQTAASFLKGMLEDSATQFVSYSVSNGLYGRLFAYEGTKISSIGDINTANGKSNKPYSIDDVKALETSTESTVYLHAIIKSFSPKEVNGFTKYDMEIYSGEENDNYTIKVSDIELGSGVDESSIEEGAAIVIQSGIEVNETTKEKTIKPLSVNGKTLNCVITSFGEPTTLKDSALSIDDALDKISSYAYGELSDDYYYVYGEVTSIENNNSAYTIRLKTNTDDTNKYFEIYNATYDTINVDTNQTINVGDTIVARGRLNANMSYVQYSK
jgi:hypothetical protein